METEQQLPNYTNFSASLAARSGPVTSSSGILGEMTMQAEPIYFYGFDYANHQKALGAGMEQ